MRDEQVIVFTLICFFQIYDQIHSFKKIVKIQSFNDYLDNSSIFEMYRASLS